MIEAEAIRGERRRLIVHDSLAFASLVTATAIVFAVTLFLFRSFSAHRADLGTRWAERGREAMQADRPDAAIVALRTALSYAPGSRPYEVLLAQALGQAGHVEESYTYFMGLWETAPGEGATNLELARLSAKKGDPQAAVNFYRAAIYGTWEGDGVSRRAAVRLELARFLIAQHQLGPARTELLVAGGNVEANPDFDDMIAGLLQQSNDSADAIAFYQKALASRAGDRTALAAAGHLSFENRDYGTAARLLARLGAARTPADEQTMHLAERILELSPRPELPANVRVARILTAAGIAKNRFALCSASLGGAGAMPAELSALAERWAAPQAALDRKALLADEARQDQAMQLVYDIERETAKLCGPASGDDAALLRMAVDR